VSSERCDTPACYREAVVIISGTAPIRWSDDDLSQPQWEDRGANACVPCAAMFKQGSGSTPNEVQWEIIDNPDEAAIEKVDEVLLSKDRTVNAGKERGSDE